MITHDTYYILTNNKFVPISGVRDILCWAEKLVNALDHEIYTDTGLPLKIDKNSGLVDYLRRSLDEYNGNVR